MTSEFGRDRNDLFLLDRLSAKEEMHPMMLGSSCLTTHGQKI